MLLLVISLLTNEEMTEKPLSIQLI